MVFVQQQVQEEGQCVSLGVLAVGYQRVACRLRLGYSLQLEIFPGAPNQCECAWVGVRVWKCVVVSV